MKLVNAAIDIAGMAAAAILLLTPSFVILAAILIFSYICARFI